MAANFPQISSTDETIKPPKPPGIVITSPFADHEIATDTKTLENIDIIIEEVPQKIATKPNDVKDMLKSPVTSLTLPAVATKLAKDIEDSKSNFNKDIEDSNINKEIEVIKEEAVAPIIDLSSLDLFSDFETPNFELFKREDLSIFPSIKEEKVEEERERDSKSDSKKTIVVVSM